MTLYKLTKSDGTTRGGMKWEVGVTNHAPSDKPAKLCTDTVLHAYTSPLLAALMNPAHGNFDPPLCFTVDGEVVVTDGTKVGCRSLRVTGTFKLPALTTTQQVAFGIYCALEVYQNTRYRQWAEQWLSGRDRSKTSANAYAAAYDYDYAYAAAADAADAAANAAADAANAAANAASRTPDFQALAEKAMEVV